MKDKMYIAIDLKSFYASVECIERKLDPITTNLVVADSSRTEKTICLAVSPSLKAYGLPGRPRLFEVIQKVKAINAKRQLDAPTRKLTGASNNALELKANPNLAVDYIIATPQMARYMQVSTEIYQVYLKYIAAEDIHVYSIDEVFMDVTDYLNTYGLTAQELARKIILDVLNTTGITATAGIGTNLYLCKIALDIWAKHTPPDENGVRIAELDEMSYRRNLWAHRPLTDFWRVGQGYAKKLASKGIYTMGDIARCSLGKPEDFYNEELLYKLFGVNAELLIDHAWGWEPCTIADIKSYKPKNTSIGSGQVLQYPYPYAKAKLVVREMADLLSLDLVDKKMVTNQLTLTLGYDIDNLKDSTHYQGEVTTDRYGRNIPKHAHGTINLENYTASTQKLINATTELFERIVDQNLLVRRIYLTASRITEESSAVNEQTVEQLELFTDYAERERQGLAEKAALEREKRMQQTMLDIKKRFGKNAILKGMNLEDGATTINRNGQIGGHKA